MMGRKRPWIEEDTAIQILVGIGAAVILGAMTKFGVFDGDDPQNDRDDEDQSEDIMAELRQTLQRLNADVGVQINGGQVTINNFAGPRPRSPDSPGSSESGSSTTGSPASPEQTVAADYGLAPMRAEARRSNWGKKVGLECPPQTLQNPRMSIPVIATVRAGSTKLLVWAAVFRDDWSWHGLYPTKTANRAATKDFLFCIDQDLWTRANAILFVAKEDEQDPADETWEQNCHHWGDLYGNGMLQNLQWANFAIDRNKELPVLQNTNGDWKGWVRLGQGTPANHTVAITLFTK